MARPMKKGIDYFSFDVDFFEDEKIEPISGEFGVKGELVVIRLLCAVYRNGYFAIWNEQLKMTLANRCKVSSELIDQVVNRLVKWEFLDKDLFDSAKIITSSGIQKRFQEATRKRKYDYSNLEYWLLNDEKRVYSVNNSDAGEFLPPITPQSKVKESKVIHIGGQQFLISSFFEEIMDEFLGDLIHIEPLCMRHSKTVIEMQDFIRHYFVDQTCEGRQGMTLGEAKQHFKNWLPYHLEKIEKKKGGKNAGKPGNRPKERDYTENM